MDNRNTVQSCTEQADLYVTHFSENADTALINQSFENFLSQFRALSPEDNVIFTSNYRKKIAQDPLIEQVSQRATKIGLFGGVALPVADAYFLGPSSTLRKLWLAVFGFMAGEAGSIVASSLTQKGPVPNHLKAYLNIMKTADHVNAIERLVGPDQPEGLRHRGARG